MTPHTLGRRFIIALCLLLAATSVGCTHQPKTKAEMEGEFTAEFGFAPPDMVESYRCSVVSVGDSLATWFSFRCPEDVFDNIHAKGYQSMHASDPMNPVPVWHSDVEFGDKNAPSWWPGVSKSETIFWKEWHSEDQAGHFIYFWRDAGSGMIYSKCGDWR